MHEMGITNRKVIAGFRSLVADKTQISDDSGWSQRLVYYHLLRYRAKLIKEKERANLLISRWNYQTIPCIPLDKTHLDECPCVPKDDCTFLKTKIRIPKPIGKLKSVTSTSGNIIYTYAEWDKLQYRINSRFAGERDSAYYTLKTGPEGTFLYLYNDIHKKYITVTGIFENPIEVQFYPGCDGKAVECRNPLDQEWILDPDLLTSVYDLALNQLFKGKQMATDVTNDDIDGISIQDDNAGNRTKS